MSRDSEYLIGKDYFSQESCEKGYGSCEVKQQITYTWKNIDVFGEIPTQSSVFRNALNRVKYCFGLGHKAPTPRKHLIKNVAGIANSGEILAVMGSSGAGKTTLLNALAFRSPVGIQLSQNAERAFNGAEIGFEELSAHCAYVEQQDLFIGSLTAREHLIFQAMLRMPKTVPYHQKVKKVDEVITELSLIKCKNTKIGNPGQSKGLSGGERKRLAFASESLTDPPIFFCDEPTSGLDSFMAHSVLQVLKRLAVKGKTIILTIHQPSSELFALFDKLLLMAEGRIAFLGTPSEASNFFSQLSTPCPSNYNPADFYVQQLAVVPGNESVSRENIRRICDTFASSDYAKEVHKSISTCKKSDGSYENNFKNEVYEYRATWWTQFRAILWRSWLNVLKEPLLVRVRLIQTVMVASLIGLIFFGQELNQDGVMNINGALFLFLTNMTFQNVFAVINVFCAELPIFLRESRSRLYSTDTYFLGKTMAELPLFLIVPLIFTSITYPMIGLRSSWTSFLIALALVTLVANVSTSAGYLISCASSSTSMALSIGPPIIIPFLLFGGFFLNSGSVPEYFKWLSYISWFRYGNEGLLINQWKDVVDGEISCLRTNATCPRSGRVILETLNFDENNFKFDFLGLILLIIGFRMFAYLALAVRARN
ncbi:Protein white [Pseudolycoriella hygida]|uniref:Protein white n=1 Tax=Pseudolycoriella hygida TaxID=35572 RepID=A0A9Q0S626_9DIPT|nr:Protein white [Pseudolycoriella hygida]